MKGGWIEIRPVWPHEGVNFRINADLAEKIGVAQGAEQLPAQDRLKIDCLAGAVLKANPQRVRSNDIKPFDSMNGMFHGFRSIAAEQWEEADALFVSENKQDRIILSLEKTGSTGPGR